MKLDKSPSLLFRFLTPSNVMELHDLREESVALKAAKMIQKIGDKPQRRGYHKLRRHPGQGQAGAAGV